MSSFRSAVIACLTVLTISFFGLDFLKTYFRYEFLVKGEACIAFDRKEDALKVIGLEGCVTIPLTKTVEEKMREKIKEEVSQELQNPKIPMTAQAIQPGTMMPQVPVMPVLTQPNLPMTVQ